MTLFLSSALRRSSASSSVAGTRPRGRRGIGSVSSFRISQSRWETTEEEYQQAQRTLIRLRDPAAVETAWHQLQQWRNNWHQSQASPASPWSSKRRSPHQHGSLSSSTNTTNTPHNPAAASSLIGETTVSAP